MECNWSEIQRGVYDVTSFGCFQESLMRISPLLSVCITASISAFSAPVAQAQAEWPTRPVTPIVPFAPGGPTDTIARLLAEQLRGQWGQTVVIDYKLGAGTIVGTQFVARAPYDGYTLGMAISAHMINPSLQPKLPYDHLFGTSSIMAKNPSATPNLRYNPVKDFSAVSLLATIENVLAAHPSVPANNVPELIRFAKANPGKLLYGSSGVCSTYHPATQDLLAGHLSSLSKSSI
jgi:tripartite-type tricarboxylate transporter receptor subunit TctC